MKILCFIDSLGPGGAQRQLVELAKGFKEKDCEVSFLTYHKINFFKPELDRVGIPVQTIVEPNYLKRIFKIRRAIRKENPDAVLSFLEGANFMATFAGFPFRKWNLVVGERSANPAILESKKLRFYRFFHLFADYVVGNSQANMVLVKKANPLLNKKKLKVIYNIPGIPAEEISSIKKLAERTDIIVAASYRKVKNLDGLIKAVQNLPKKYQNELTINWYGEIYEREYFEAVQKLIADLKLEEIIRLNQAVNNIHQKYYENDFVGLFSHFEGFPNTINEALAMGKPVIVTRVSDIPLFLQDGVNGFLCESRDIISIQNALIKAVESSIDERFSIGENNKNLAVTHFSKERIIENYLQLLSE